MQEKVKAKGITFGLNKRIAVEAKTSAETVRKVLTEKPGVSDAMKKKVLIATKKVLRQAAREKQKIHNLFLTTLPKQNE